METKHKDIKATGLQWISEYAAARMLDTTQLTFRSELFNTQKAGFKTGNSGIVRLVYSSKAINEIRSRMPQQQRRWRSESQVINELNIEFRWS